MLIATRLSSISVGHRDLLHFGVECTTVSKEKVAAHEAELRFSIAMSVKIVDGQATLRGYIPCNIAS